MRRTVVLERSWKQREEEDQGAMSREVATQHLDAATWRELLAAPDAHDALLEHMRQGCEVCDAFLASQVDDLDGAVDRALLGLSRGQDEQDEAAPLDEVGWQRLRRRLPGRSGGVRRLVGLAAAVSLAIGAGTLLGLPSTPSWDGTKGGSSGPALEVAAAVQKRGDSFVRLDDGARLTRDAVLVFQATSTIEGPARLYLQRGQSAPVELGVTELEAGTHELRTDTGLLGVSLAGEQGQLSVWIVAAERPFSHEEAFRAIEAHGSPDLAAARVRVNVE